jgi:hypothetical protein
MECGGWCKLDELNMRSPMRPHPQDVELQSIKYMRSQFVTSYNYQWQKQNEILSS